MLYALKSQDTLINKFKGYEIEEEQAAKIDIVGSLSTMILT